MNYLGKYCGDNVYTILFGEYYDLYQRGKIDPRVYYIITDDNNKMILNGEVVGRALGNQVVTHSTRERYSKVFEKLQKDIYKLQQDMYKSCNAFSNEVKDKDRGIEVKEIIFTDYSMVVDKFFEDLKNVKYDV